ncbi:MAG TPA: septation protein SepH, partial [Acidimicrobiales bacterium]|nr:septation protein SepH [Acidimicrobiales bacterium]
MQRLHLVGLTEDADGLIFSTRRGAKSGGFVVSVDPDLLAVLEEANGGSAKARKNGRGATRSPRSGTPQSQLSPREMQDLLRGGWTLDEVAAEAGVDVDWVSRFASPVMAEIARVIEHAIDAVFDKPRVGPSALPLGDSVRRNIAERGVRLTDEEFEGGWRAWQQDDETWLVSFTYTSRGRDQEAEWVLDLDEDDLLAGNRLGSQLGHVVSTRRRVSTTPPPPKPTSKASTAKAAATKAAPKSAARPRATATKTAKKKASATKKGAGGRKRPPAVEVEPEAPPPRPNTTEDVYRDELRRRQEREGVRRPAPRPMAEPELRTEPVAAGPDVRRTVD